MISREQLDSISESSRRKFTESTFWLNSSGNIIYIGNQFTQLSGYRSDELLQQHISLLIPSFKADSFFHETIDSPAIGLTSTLYSKLRCEIPVSLQLTSETLDDDKILIVLVARLGNNSESLAEAEIELLTEQNELLLFLIDEVPSPLVVKNYAGKFVLTNKALAELYGAPTPASMIGKDDGDYIPDQKIAEEFRDNVRQIMDEGETRTVFEDTIDVETGERRNFQSIKKPFRTKQNDKQILLIATDVTTLRNIQTDLEEQKNLFRQVIDELPSPFIVKDYDGKFVLTNKALANLYNVDDPDSMIGKDDSAYLTDIKHADDFKHNVRAIMDRGTPQVVYEDSFDAKTGERRHYMSIKKPFTSPKGEKQILVIANDITEIQQAQSTLMQYEKIISVSHDFLSYEDTEYRYQAVNDTYVEAFLMDKDQIIGKSSSDLFGEDFFSNALKPHFDKALEGKESHYETWIDFPALGRRFVDISHHPYLSVKTSEIEGVVTKINDITDRYEAQEKLRHLADHDILTQLPNRRKFAERLTRALYRGKRNDNQVAVFFIDLDRFKVINDSLGHSVGDLVLQEIATRLQKRIRITDTLARSGGDEFLLLLEDFSSLSDVTTLCESLLEELKKPILHEGHELFISASIGVSMYPRDATNEEELIQCADAAMYQAKKRGRNTYQLSDENLRVQATKRFSLEKDLRSALQNNEFTLYFQPQVEMATQKIFGSEALLRWQHPQEGFISPATFIPVAEDCGVIIPLGQWVLESACRQMTAWLKDGYQLEVISVNISGNQLLQTNFTEMVKRCLTDTQLPANRLELEITESYLMSDTKMAAKQLEELRNMGVSVAIDDFGTGHSSLRYLQELPISKLKIDRSFVRDVPDDKGDCAIVKTIIGLANNLEISVIAEGVEEEKQEAFLLAEGCRLAQGFKYGRPVNKNDFEKLLIH